MCSRRCYIAVVLLAACGQRGSAGNSSGADKIPGEQLLYDLGSEPPADVYHLHVDGDVLYWAQNAGKLMRGPKGGGGEPELFARWEHVAEGSSILTDATHVYYYDGQLVKRQPKAGGEVQQYDVGAGNTFGNFTLDGDYIYQAPPWCSPLYRIHKESGEQTVLTLPDVVTDGGTAFLAVVGGKLYCANLGATGGRIYEVAADATAPVAIREGAMIWGMAVSTDSLIFSTGASTIDRMKLNRLDLASRQETFLAQAPLAAAGELELDASRNAVFVNYPSTAGQVGVFDLESLAFSLLIPHGRFMRRAFTTDADYVYWAEQSSKRSEQIRRISKDAPPVSEH